MNEWKRPIRTINFVLFLTEGLFCLLIFDENLKEILLINWASKESSSETDQTSSSVRTLYGTLCKHRYYDMSV